MEQIMVHLGYGVDVFVHGVSKMVHCIVIGHLRKKIGTTCMKMISAAEQSFTHLFKKPAPVPCDTFSCVN
jgi:hypothetical protein